MSNNHTGNMHNEILREEHDGDNNARRVNVVAGTITSNTTVTLNSTPTLFAVVNTSAAGQSSVRVDGNVTLSDSKTYIGLVTSTNASPVTLAPSPNYIGLTTTTLGSGLANVGFATVAVSTPTLFAVVNTAAAGQSSVKIDGNVTLSDSKTYIGLTTTTLGSSTANVGFATVNQVNQPALVAGEAYIGLVTVANASIPVTQSGTWDEVGIHDSGNSITVDGTVGLGAGVAGIGFATVNQVNQPALTAGAAYIGLATVDIGSGNVGLNAGVNGIGFATVAVSTPTLFAVVNTQAAGQASVRIDGNVTLSDAKTFIGLVTVGGIGTVTLADPKGYIGLTTTTLGASPAFIGIVTVTNASIPVTQSGTWDEVGINDSGNSITVDGTVALGAGVANVGFASVTPVSAWPDPKTFIGLVTVGGIGTVTLSDPKGFIGLVTVGGMSTVTLTDSKTYIGLVTATSLDGGSRKTFIHKNIELSSSSIATIYVSTETFKITNVLINSDATVRVSIKSGATYLTGNASIGITLNPGGGWVESGSPRSPLYYGLAVDQAIVVEKFDMTATSARVGGKVIFIDE